MQEISDLYLSCSHCPELHKFCPHGMLIFFSKVKYVYVRIQIKLVCSCLCWCDVFFKVFVSLHLILLEIVVLNYIKRIFKEKRTVMSNILG